MVRFITAWLVFYLVFAGSQAQAQQLIDKPGLVSTDWLTTNLNAPGLRIIDARSGLTPYVQGHVPGAVYLNVETLRASIGGVPGTRLSDNGIAEILGAIGVSEKQDVVVYSGADDNLTASTYVATLIEYLGNPHVAVLDGGFDKWKAEGRPVTKDLPKVEQTTFNARPKKGFYVDASDVQQAKDESTLVLDARGKQNYFSGHIPGAANMSVSETMTSGSGLTWKSPEELKQQANKSGASGKPVVTYCTSGREASHLAFTLRHVLGMPNVRVYDGSMLDWTARDLPKDAGETTGSTPQTTGTATEGKQ